MLFAGQCYKAAYDYTATTDDEISFPAGVEIEILEKNLEGWWLAWWVKTGFDFLNLLSS